MSKVLAVACYILLILLSITAAVLYCGVYQDNASDLGYGLFSLLCAVEGLVSGLSLAFYMKNKRNRVVTAVFVLSVVLAIPVLIVGVFWLFESTLLTHLE